MNLQQTPIAPGNDLDTFCGPEVFLEQLRLLCCSCSEIRSWFLRGRSSVRSGPHIPPLRSPCYRIRDEGFCTGDRDLLYSLASERLELRLSRGGEIAVEKRKI